jgi:hypothetical protein
MTTIAINLSTQEYFIYTSDQDKQTKIKKLTDYTTGTKIMSFLLKTIDSKITIDQCGETRWDPTNDKIIFNVDVNEFNEKYYKFDYIKC